MLLFRCTDSKPHASSISRLRSLTSLSISDIRTRAAKGEALIEIEAFRNDWQEARLLLVNLSRLIEDGSLPLSVSDLEDGVESPVSPEMLRGLIDHYRGIELETQMHTELELGEINDRSEFVPQDEDWTR